MKISNLIYNKSAVNYLKLFSAGIIILWLFIQSPLNPLYTDLDSSEYFYTYYNFIYWTLASVFFLWMIFFVNRESYKKYLTAIFLGLITLHYLHFIPFGFEVTDTGFHLSNQSDIFQGYLGKSFDSIAGTNLIGGLWLLIPGKPFLLWSRLGFVIVQAGIIYFSYKILTRYFNKLRTFIVCMITAISLSFWQYYNTINYDNLSLFLLLISVYLFIKGNIQTLKSKEKLFFIAGIFIMISIFCKITYAPAVLFPLFIQYTDKKRRKRIFIIYAWGLLAGTVLIAGYLIMSKGYAGYIENINSGFSEFIKNYSTAERDILVKDHSFKNLYWIYKNEIRNILKILISIFTSVLLYNYLLSRLEKNRPLKYFFLIFMVWLFYFLIFEPIPALGIAAFSLTLLIIWLITAGRKEMLDHSDIIMLSITVLIVSFIGSDLGVITSIRSGGILLFLSALMLLLIDSKLIYKDIKVNFRYLFYISLAVFSIYYIQDKFRPYQDFEYKFMTDSFKSPQLIGIKSNKDRVEVVDSLLTYLNDIPDIKDKDIYFAKHSPMYYYLTGTKYRLDSPWDTLNDLDEIKKDFESSPPELFVLPKGSHRNYKWPNEDESWKKEGGELKAQPYYDFYDQFIKENNYIEVYKNSFYTVYSLEDKDGTDEQSTE